MITSDGLADLVDFYLSDFRTDTDLRLDPREDPAAALLFAENHTWVMLGHEDDPSSDATWFARMLQLLNSLGWQMTHLDNLPEQE